MSTNYVILLTDDVCYIILIRYCKITFESQIKIN